ncbi:MAG: KH domain-containing protein [Clostridia bacterium]|nr:KH domain-containing protein [Clostridia bacterium]MBQ8792059.1 KH domain-containing protein [Clostridia bacterium]
MKEIVEYIVKSLVVDKDAVKVTETEEENQTVINVCVAEDDMGRVIGKSGNVASSIRTIIKSISSRTGKKVFVKFGE